MFLRDCPALIASASHSRALARSPSSSYVVAIVERTRASPSLRVDEREEFERAASMLLLLRSVGQERQHRVTRGQLRQAARDRRRPLAGRAGSPSFRAVSYASFARARKSGAQ